MRKPFVIAAVAAVVLAVVGGLGYAELLHPSGNRLGLAGVASAAQATPTPTTEKPKEHPFIGVWLERIGARLVEHFQLQEKSGVVIVRVGPDSPAAKAGLKAGDVLKSVGGTSVKTVQDAVKAVRESSVGETLSVIVLRGSQAVNVNVTVGTAPPGLREGLKEGFQRWFMARRGRFAPPDIRRLFEGIPPGERFGHVLGDSLVVKDKDGNQVTIHVVPGKVTAVSTDSITIAPNDPSAKAGPYQVDKETAVRGGIGSVKVGEKVAIVYVGDSNHAAAIAGGMPLGGTMAGPATGPRPMPGPAPHLWRAPVPDHGPWRKPPGAPAFEAPGASGVQGWQPGSWPLPPALALPPVAPL